MAVFFAVFQVVMPLVGWAVGVSFRQSIEGVDHWVAFFLLLLVGGRMVLSGLSAKKPSESGSCSDEKIRDCRHLPTLVLLSIATSLDALAIGITFAVMEVALAIPLIVIGLVTGGLVLVGIGVKILLGDLLA